MPLGELLALRRLCYRTLEGAQIGPIDWEIRKGERILLDCPADAYEGLLRVISQQIEPSEGYLEEIVRVVIQTDRHLRASISPNRSVQELLETINLPDSVWLDHQRHSLWVVMDRLGLDSRLLRLPIKLEPPGLLDKVWALRFVASRAQLLIGREIFMVADPLIRRVLASRWPDFPGTVICAAPESDLPGAVHTRAFIAADGSFRLLRPPEPEETPPPPGPDSA